MKARLLRLLAFSMLLFVVLEPFRWVVTCIALLLATLKPGVRWQVLMVASVIMWFDRFPYMPFSIGPWNWDALLTTLCAIGFCYLLAYLCLLQNQRTSMALGLPFAFYVLLMVVADNCPVSAFRILKCSVYVFQALLWPLIVTALMPKILTRFSRVQVAAMLLPFWQTFTILPIPIGPTLLLSHEAGDDVGFDRMQRAGLVLLAGCLGVLVFMRGFEKWAFAWPFMIKGTFQDISRYYVAGNFDAFLALHGHSRTVMFAGILAVFFRFIVVLGTDIGISVAMARLLGFELPAMINFPLAATSLGNFFSRLLYYYNQLLMKTSFLLWWKLLPRSISLRAKVGLSVFLSVFLGGYFFHLLRDLPMGLGSQSLGRSLINYVNLFPYYFLIGLAASWSTARRAGSGRLSRAWVAFRGVGYFVVYSCIYSLSSFVNHDGKSWGEILQIGRQFLP